jgi:MFS family permease
MTTLVVGPFYLSGALGLGAAAVGAVMSVGPMIVAVSGVPAGRTVDRFGPQPIIMAGTSAIAAGCVLLSQLPVRSGILGYILALAVLTLGYSLFQAANNSAVMMKGAQGQRGVLSGLLHLSRNLGLITGASAMGAVFAHKIEGAMTAAAPDIIANAMRFTFGIAAALMLLALALLSAPLNWRQQRMPVNDGR